MNLLAIDTSSPALSVALLAAGAVEEIHRESDERHSRDLVGQIDTLLTGAGIAPASLSGIAIGHGPGAFTGVRLGIAVAQGLGVALDIPLVPVSSLAVVAQRAVACGHSSVVVAQDARMNEVYTARYVACDALAELAGNERVAAPEAVALAAPDAVAGDAWERIPQLTALAGTREPVARWPHAADLITLASAAVAAGATVAAEDAAASYLRDSVVR